MAEIGIDMCDTGNIMANQMDDMIQAGINEHDAMCDEITELKKENQTLRFVIFGSKKHNGMIRCLDPYYIGCWDKRLGTLKNLQKKDRAFINKK